MEIIYQKETNLFIPTIPFLSLSSQK